MRQHDRMGADTRPVRRGHHKRIPYPLDVLDGAMANLDVRMLLELPPPGGPQVRRPHPFMPEQPAHTSGHGIRRPVVIDHEHAPVRAAQHESRAQPRRPATDDHGVIRPVTPGIEAVEPVGHSNLDATTPGDSFLPARFGG
jgi:hypothetical protein